MGEDGPRGSVGSGPARPRRRRQAHAAIAAWSRLDSELALLGVGQPRRRLLGAAILQTVVLATMEARRAGRPPVTPV